MEKSKFYVDINLGLLRDNDRNYNKVNKKYSIEVIDDFHRTPFIDVCVGRYSQIDDRIPKSYSCDKYKSISEEEFMEYFNGNYAALQNLNIRGGDYYIERNDQGTSFTFHVFFEKTHYHCFVSCKQDIDGSSFAIHTRNTISWRPGVKKRGKHLSEEVFCEIYRMVLEFLYDGSSMPARQVQLFEVVKGMVGPDSPKMQVVINQESYYIRARNLMLQRKDELKARLVEMDDKEGDSKVSCLLFL